MCPSWGGRPWGPKTWVMEVVGLKEVKNGALIALVEGTINVLLLFAEHITPAQPLLSRWPKSGRKCYITPCILGGPQTKGDEI